MMMKKMLVLGLSSLFSLSAMSATVNTKASSLNWVGKKVTGKHEGTIAIKEVKDFKLEDGKITSGTIVIDMNSMTVTDIKPADGGDKLLGHLKTDDFFGVEKYPTASFAIKSDTGSALVGDLTIKGKTQKDVTLKYEKNGMNYKGTAKVDRTKFDIRYGSASFFSNLADKAIDNEFELAFNVVVE
jgi:polyisoprenoid-binding protein YceI